MTIPYIDFRRSRGPSLGEQIVSAGVQNLIADAFRKSAERRAEERTIAAENREEARSERAQQFGAQLLLETEQSRNLQKAQFDFENAVRTGQLVPEEELTAEQRSELRGAQYVTGPVTGRKFYSVQDIAGAAPVSPNLVPALNRLQRQVGLESDITPEGRTPQGLLSQTEVAGMTPLLSQLSQLTQARIGKEAAAINAVQVLKREPDLEKWAGLAVRDETFPGGVRPLYLHEMVDLDNKGNFETLAQATGDATYMERFSRTDELERNLIRIDYIDPSVVEAMAAQLRNSSAGEPIMTNLANHALSIGSEGLLWQVRPGKEPRPIRDPGEAVHYIEGNQSLLEALLYHPHYPSARALMEARTTRRPMPSPGALGYLQHIWRLTGQDYSLPADLAVTEPPEASIYMNMVPRRLSSERFLDAAYADSVDVGALRVPVVNPATGMPSDTTMSPAIGSAVEPTPQTATRPAPLTVPSVYIDPTMRNYGQLFSTAYSAIAVDTASYSQMVESVNGTFATPQSAMQFYLDNPVTSRSPRIAELKAMLDSGDPEKVAFVKDVFDWERIYVLNTIRDARDAYNDHTTPGHVPVMGSPIRQSPLLPVQRVP